MSCYKEWIQDCWSNIVSRNIFSSIEEIKLTETVCTDDFTVGYVDTVNTRQVSSLTSNNDTRISNGLAVPSWKHPAIMGAIYMCSDHVRPYVFDMDEAFHNQKISVRL